MAVTHALEAGRRLEIPVAPSQSDFRLTLATGDPTPATDQLAKTTLYLTHDTGNVIALRVGGRWAPASSAEVSLSLAGLLANTVYDIFAFWTGAAVALEALAWASATARATALVRQDGVQTKSGDPTRRWVGTISTTAAAGQCEDSYVKRYVWNAQNRVLRPLRRLDPTGTWTYTTVNTWRQARADAANEVGVVLGLLTEPIGVGVYCWGWHSASNAGFVMGIGEDSTTAPLATGLSPQVGTSPSQGFTPIIARFDGWPAAIGRHRYVWLERNNTGGTLNLYGTDATNGINSGMTGAVWA
jgi:hypothetical protein